MRLLAHFVGALRSFAVLALAIPIAQAQWTVVEHKDAMTDQVYWIASTQSPERHGLSITKLVTRGVVMSFSLSSDMFEQIDPRRSILYRIDNHPAIVPRDTRWEPRFVRIGLDWSSRNGRGEELVQIMSGKKLLLRFPVNGGGSRDVAFSLDGARDVIAQAIGIKMEMESGALDKIESTARVRAELNARCVANAVKEDYSVCMSKGQQ